MSILRQLLLLAGLAALAYAGYYGWQGYAVSRSATGTKPATAAAILVDAEPAALRTMTTTVEAVGSTIAARSIQVVSLAEGRVHALHFKAGQKVQEGAVLVELDRDLQEADLAEAEAVHKRAVADLERAQSLFGSKVVSEARVQELTALAAAAQAQVMRARRQLADRTIRAPSPARSGSTASTSARV